MIRPEDVGWGEYREYEGVFFRGTVKFKLPDKPYFSDKLINVLTATEGGRADAINMYDKCIISGGFIQWCEGGQYSLSALLGDIAEHNNDLLEGGDFSQKLAEQGYIFTNLVRNKWRFYKQLSGGGMDEVDTLAEQQKLFLLNSNGRKGTWGPKGSPSRKHAAEWAAAVANVLADPIAVHAQVGFTADRLRWFLLPFSKDIFPLHEEHQIAWNNVAYAAYLSYAGNNPTWANTHLQIFAKDHPLPPYSSGGYMWDEGSVVALLKQLTFGPQVGIYPHRYNAIRPVLEKLWGVNLPDFAEELKKVGDWSWSAVDTQQMLVDVGFDIGSSGVHGDGVDGSWGPKSQAALMSFQRDYRLPQTGFPDKATMEALAAAALEDKDDEETISNNLTKPSPDTDRAPEEKDEVPAVEVPAVPIKSG